MTTPDDLAAYVAHIDAERQALNLPPLNGADCVLLVGRALDAMAEAVATTDPGWAAGPAAARVALVTLAAMCDLPLHEAAHLLADSMHPERFN